MYPGTIITKPWTDMSQIETNTPDVIDNRPLFLTASSFDKGPEKMMKVSGDDFFALYGDDIKFSKHGQAAIQAAAIINAGGRLLVKRVVAEDSTLANVVFFAILTVTTTEADEEEGTEASTSVTIKWIASSFSGCTTKDEIDAAITTYIEENYSDLEDGVSIYPVLIVTDNGRGVSSKKVRLSANDYLSISAETEFYTVRVYEGTSSIESTYASLNYALFNNELFMFNEDSMVQVVWYVDEDQRDALIAAIAEALGVDEDEVTTYDLLNATTVKGTSIDNFTLDSESIDFDAKYGIELSGGDNGSFGSNPVGTDAWEEQLIQFFDGSFDPAIFDLDDYKICAVCDACYPYEVKAAIAELVEFRQDCMFFRDMCFDASSYTSAIAIKDEYFDQNYFVSDYMTFYKVKDPVTRRNIQVTMMYDFAPCLVKAYDKGIHFPCAGIANGFILGNAIEGTINYTPRVMPEINQKQLMDDARINYAIFYEGQCIVQSLYTSQDAYTQLSYANNVLAIQEVIRAIRVACPKKRYTFIENGDFSEYASAVNKILQGYRVNFDILRFEYTKNLMESNAKIFHASIRFAFKDWAQTEIFDIIAISNNEVDTDEDE